MHPCKWGNKIRVLFSKLILKHWRLIQNCKLTIPWSWRIFVCFSYKFASNGTSDAFLCVYTWVSNYCLWRWETQIKITTEYSGYSGEHFLIPSWDFSATSSDIDYTTTLYSQFVGEPFLFLQTMNWICTEFQLCKGQIAFLDRWAFDNNINNKTVRLTCN